MREYLIRLPWPPKELTPNYRRSHHWTAYATKANKYRETCWKETLAVTGASPSGLSKPLPMLITFHPPDRRHRDDDGIIGSFKIGRDGVADALGVDDRHFRPTYEFADPKKGGCILVHIEHRGIVT